MGLRFDITFNDRTGFDVERWHAAGEQKASNSCQRGNRSAKLTQGIRYDRHLDDAVTRE